MRTPVISVLHTVIFLIQREGKNNYFLRLVWILRGYKLQFFRRCDSALIIRGKLINMDKIRGIFIYLFIYLCIYLFIYFEKRINYTILCSGFYLLLFCVNLSVNLIKKVHEYDLHCFFLSTIPSIQVKKTHSLR